MADLITARVDKKMRKRFTRLARRKRISTSHAVREAISAWIEQQEPAESFYQRIKHLAGVVRGGDPGRSSDGGRKFAEYLKARRRRH